jgi:hypothetical protein
MLIVRWRAILIAFITLLLMSGAAWGQNITPRNGGLWFDYDPVWPLGARLALDVAVSARIVDSEPRLWEARLQPTLTLSPKEWVDLTVGAWLIYGGATDGNTFFETRPYAGIRLKADIWRGVNLSSHFRVEERIIHDLETGEAEARRRLRERIQVMIPINHRTLSEDNTWYALVSAEFFWERGVTIQGVFGSQQRYWAGLGWRKDSTWRFEFLYLLQRIKPSATAPFPISNHIINVRLTQNFK